MKKLREVVVIIVVCSNASVLKSFAQAQQGSSRPVKQSLMSTDVDVPVSKLTGVGAAAPTVGNIALAKSTRSPILGASNTGIPKMNALAAPAPKPSQAMFKGSLKITAELFERELPTSKLSSLGKAASSKPSSLASITSKPAEAVKGTAHPSPTTLPSKLN